MVGLPEGYPKPRHEYLYQPMPGLGNRGLYHRAGQIPNGALPAPVYPGMAGYRMGMGYGMGGYGMGYPGGVGHPRNYYPNRNHLAGGGLGSIGGAGCFGYPHGYAGHGYGSYGYYPAYSGHPHYGYYGGYRPYMYANYYPYRQRYYTTGAAVVPASTVTYGVPAARTTTYTTTSAPPVQRRVEIPTASYVCGRTQSEVQLENRRIATERGAYAPRRIKPADANPDDPFWCKERNGEWHLRTFYQIENECYPGRWAMDAEIGYLVFHRE